MAWITAIIIAYMVLMLAIGWRFRETANQASDFILANRSLGKWIVAFSLMWSAWSGYTFTGLIGVTYLNGLKAVFIGLASLGGLMAMYLAYSMRLRPLTIAFGSLTIVDVLSKRYYDKGNVIRILGSMLAGALYAGVVAPQLLAIGVVLNAVTGLDIFTGVVLGAVVVVAYTCLGGFKAACYTDFVQGLIMLSCGIILLFASLALAGGVLPGLALANQVAGSGYTDPIGTQWLTNTNLLLVFVFTWPGLLHAAVRFMSAKSATENRTTYWIVVATSILIAFPIILAATLMRGLMPEVAPPARESMVFLFSLKHMHPLFTGLFTAALMAAVMSTVDSALLFGANAVVRDFVKGIFKPNMTDKEEVRYTRVALIVITILAVTWITQSRETILGLIIFANSILAAALGVPLVFACWWKRATREGAIASMILGPIAVIVWKQTGMSSLVVESVFGFLFSSLVLVAVSLATKPPPAEILAKLDEALGHGALGTRRPLAAQPVGALRTGNP